MNKLIKILTTLTVMVLFLSCDLEEAIEYETLTQEKYESISRQLNGIDIEDLSDTAMEAQGEAQVEAVNAYTDSAVTKTFSGTGYSGTVTYSSYFSNFTEVTITETFTNETYYDGNTTVTYSGTITMTSSVRNNFSMNTTTEEITGSQTVKSLTTMDLTFSGAEFSSLSGDMNLSYNLTADELTDSSNYEQPDFNCTGTLVIDGYNYKSSDFYELAFAD